MHITPEAEALLDRLAAVAPADDVAELRVAVALEASRLRHEVVVPGHVATVLVRSGADADLLAELGIDPASTSAQLLDRTKAEVDAAAAAVAPVDSVETVVVSRPGRAIEATVCPECGADLQEHRRYETRRVPNPGRGSTMARVAMCGACGAVLGPS